MDFSLRPHFLRPALRLLAGLAVGTVSAQSVHTCAEKDTLPGLGERLLGSADAGVEILNHNRLGNPAELRPGLDLMVPGPARAQALADRAVAEAALEASVQVRAPEFAKPLYDAGLHSLEKARKAQLEGRYDQAVMFARLARLQAEESVRAAARAAAADDPAVLSAVSGRVEVSVDGRVTWALAKVGDPVPPRASVRAAEQSRAELRLGDGTTLQIAPGGLLEIPVNTLDRRNQVRDTRIRVLLGEILGEIAPRKDPKSEFKLQADKSSISVRGTVLRVESEPNGLARVGMLEGLAGVSLGERSVDLRTGFGIVADPAKPLGPPEPLPPDPGSVWPAGERTETANQRPELRWPAGRKGDPARVRAQIARDNRFNDLVLDERLPAAAGAARAPVLLPGDYFTRLSTVSPRGLEGAPTPVRRLTVRAERNIRLDHPAPAFLEKGVAHVRPGFRIRARPAAVESSITAITSTVNKEPAAEEVVLDREGVFDCVFYGSGPDRVAGPEASLRVVVDARPPDLGLATSHPFPAEQRRERTRVVLDARDENGVGGVEFRTGDGRWQPYTGPVDVTHLDDMRFEARAVDRVGNTSAVHTLILPGSRVK